MHNKTNTSLNSASNGTLVFNHNVDSIPANTGQCLLTIPRRGIMRDEHIHQSCIRKTPDRVPSLACPYSPI